MTEIETQDAGCMARRPFLRAVGAAGTAAIVGGAGIRSSTQEAEAIAPAVIGAGLAATTAIGWLVRDHEIIGSDAPPEGLTADALLQNAYQTIRTRQSTNASTFIDNRNILSGIEQVAYADGKIAAIEALNEQLSESDVLDAATDAVNDYETTILKNLLRSWNESVLELDATWELIEDHQDAEQALTVLTDDGNPDLDDYSMISYSMPDGTNFDVFQIEPYQQYFSWEPTNSEDNLSDRNVRIQFDDPDAGNVEYMRGHEWHDLYLDITQEFSNVRDGLVTWVDAVYSDVQSGEIDVGELITPRERAEMMADGETIAPAIADLIALNMPVDPEREATITLLDDDVTLIGTFARTANPEGEPLESGETYDPATLTGDVFFTYDIAMGEGIWNEVETGVDGGTVTFTSEPHAETLFRIHTTAGETAEVVTGDFTEDETAGVWEVDISEQVEDSITEVDSVNFYSESGDSQYETIRLDQSFEIEKFEDSDGNEVQSATFEQNSEPQDDTNYITQEEWDEMARRNQELIEKYEDAQSSGGGGWMPDFDGAGGPIVGALIGAAALLGLTQIAN